MSTYYNAKQSSVEAANIAMFEIVEADGGYLEKDVLDEKLREVWEPATNALCVAVRNDFFNRHYPALSAYADSLGADFVGVTSDTHAVVRWKDCANIWFPFRVFAIETTPEDAIAWKYGDVFDPPRWVFDESDFYAIAAEDFALLVPVNADKDD